MDREQAAALEGTAAARALGGRLRELRAAMDRFDSFAFAPGDAPQPAALERGQELAAARDLVLRAIGRLGDPVNYGVLQLLSKGDAEVASLAAAGSIPRLAMWERVNDLLQVGLVGRATVGDMVGLTPAGRRLVDLVEGLAEDAAKEAGP